jgi:hypothetical protein
MVGTQHICSIFKTKTNTLRMTQTNNAIGSTLDDLTKPSMEPIKHTKSAIKSILGLTKEAVAAAINTVSIPLGSTTTFTRNSIDLILKSGVDVVSQVKNRIVMMAAKTWEAIAKTYFAGEAWFFTGVSYPLRVPGLLMKGVGVVGEAWERTIGSYLAIQKIQREIGLKASEVVTKTAARIKSHPKRPRIVTTASSPGAYPLAA